MDTLAYLDFDTVFGISVDLELPIVPLIEEDVEITMDLIKKYAEELELINEFPFEGVVIKSGNKSFKVISLAYDSKK